MLLARQVTDGKHILLYYRGGDTIRIQLEIVVAHVRVLNYVHKLCTNNAY